MAAFLGSNKDQVSPTELGQDENTQKGLAEFCSLNIFINLWEHHFLGVKRCIGFLLVIVIMGDLKKLVE